MAAVQALRRCLLLVLVAHAALGGAQSPTPDTNATTTATGNSSTPAPATAAPNASSTAAPGPSSAAPGNSTTTTTTTTTGNSTTTTTTSSTSTTRNTTTTITTSTTTTTPGNTTTTTTTTTTSATPPPPPPTSCDEALVAFGRNGGLASYVRELQATVVPRSRTANITAADEVAERIDGDIPNLNGQLCSFGVCDDPAACSCTWTLPPGFLSECTRLSGDICYSSMTTAATASSPAYAVKDFAIRCLPTLCHEQLPLLNDIVEVALSNNLGAATVQTVCQNAPPSDQGGKKSNKLSQGAVAGIVIGLLFGVGISLFAVYYFWAKQGIPGMASSRGQYQYEVMQDLNRDDDLDDETVFATESPYVEFQE